MPVAPRDVEGLAILFEPEWDATFARNRAEAVGGVNLPDAVDGRHLESRLAGVRIEFEGTGPDHRVIRNLLGPPQIPSEARVLHELHIAEIRAPLAANRIGGGVDAHLTIQTGEILNGVSILAARQASDGDSSGVACVLFC